MPIPAGIPAPTFELLDDTNTLRKLSDFRGKNVVLYFYPKDGTPDCNTQACAFRDAAAEFSRNGASIVGISRDDIATLTPEATKISGIPYVMDIDKAASAKMLDIKPTVARPKAAA